MLTASLDQPSVIDAIARPYILIVDDHEPSLFTLQRILELNGHHCVASCSASEALALCDAHCPTIVVTDLSMPDIDGHGLALGLKARYPSLPILLMTGEDLDNASSATLYQTFDAVLAKPIALDSLLALLDAHIANRPAI